MMVVRGVTEVMGAELSNGASASISGMAGIFHICFAVGIIMLVISLKKAVLNK